jgi:hypothetical protein
VRAIVAVVVFALLVLILFILSFSTPPVFGLRLTGVTVQFAYNTTSGGYFGPSQSVCAACPEVLDNNAAFSVTFLIHNSDPNKNHTVSEVKPLAPSLAGPSPFRVLNTSANVSSNVTPYWHAFSIPPGQSAVLTVRLLAPPARGNYDLTLVVFSGS